MWRVLLTLGAVCAAARGGKDVRTFSDPPAATSTLFNHLVNRNITEGLDYVATNFTFLDCNTYSSCTQCVSSSFPCDWCVDGHRCTHDTAENCRNDILVTGVGRTGPSYRSGPGFCSRITSTSDGTNEILVPYGVKKAIKVKVRVIGQFIVQTRFVCQFNIEGRVMHVNAQLLADTIYCDAVEFTYTTRAPNMTASFAFVWGGSKPLDNPDNFHLLIYRCSDMADNCGLCLSLSEKFGCGWCQGSDRCEVQGQCGAPSVWFDRRQTCPNAAVHSLHPQVDPSDGTTNITNETSTQDTCSTYKSCTQCVSSSFSCDWCLDSHRCTHDTAESCRNDILVTGFGRTGPSYRSGPGFCPRINSTFDGTNEILVPYGVKKAIKVKVRVIGQFIVQTRFVCQFNIEGRVMHVNAQLLADTIYCDAVEFTYTSRAPNMTASFAIVWGGSKPLDNPDNVHLLIYRCNDMADNCGLCLSLSEKVGCGWCQGSDRCEVRGQCGAPSVWLDRRQICPKTEVHTLHPQVDPSDGTTNITTNETSTQDTCSTYKSCTQCVSSSFPCDWCLDSHRCTHDTAESCRNDILVTGVGRTGPSYRSGPRFCPRINSTFDGRNEILVPYGVKKAIKVKVRVIGQFIVQTRFVCQFYIEGRVMHVNAQLLANTIYCDAMEFTYTSRAPNMTASFAIVWGGSKPLDNPDNVHLLIYRCSDMADNCGLCLSLSEKFGCGWCQGSDRCEVQGQCGAPSVWLNQGQTCPNAAVHSLHPQIDPSNGTTNITNETSTQDTCSTYKSCTQCVSSSFPCDWCLDSHRCTHDTAESCRNDILVTGVGRTGPSYRSGSGFCPRINSTSDGTNEILVPYGVKKAIKVKVRVIGQFIVQTRFVCQFNIEGRVMHVNAQLLADTIYCDAMEFTYTSRAPNMTSSFAIVWGGSKPLDNPDNVHLLIYRCSDMADNCGLCLSLPEKFGCGWCQGSDRCEVQGQCGASSVWLNQGQTCPKAAVHSLHPQVDPSDAITNITSNETSKQDTCSTYKSCTQCVSSSFPCDWCLDGHRCTHNTAESCRNDILVTGVGRTSPSYRSGLGFCPRINSTFDGRNEILVPYGVKKAIKVKVRVIGQFIVQTRFVCQFYIEGRVMHVNAQLLADTIYCDAMEFTYTSRAPNMTASFAIVWGGSKPLDNPDNVHLLIYRCSDMADNCGLCLSLSEKFGCGWCQGSDRCEVQGQCGAPSVWLNQGQTCPNAAVHSLHPQIDPSNGTTNITNETSTQDTCSTYKSCTQCVSSSFPCDWCLDSHRCTHDTAESCRNDILVTGVGRTGPSYRSGSGFCPRINSTSDGTNEILVPYGVKKAIKVKVRVIGQFIVQTRFVCQFNIEGRVMHVNAQLLADTIYCDAMEFTYTSRAPNMTASFAIVWGGSKPLDNPDNVHLLIYRCSDMADNCGLCLSLPEKFGCGWCQGSDRCEVQGQCGASSVWLNQGQTCPKAAVHSLHPQVDPSDAITNITSNETSKQDTCSTYKSCTQCVSSSFPCDWCLDGHRCTHNTAESCRNDILVTGVGRTSPSYRSGLGFCPRINSTSDGTNEILVPYGVKKAIKVKVRVIGQFIVQTRFVCQFNIEGRVMHVNAQLLAATVYCDAMEFTYTSRAPNMTASFAIVWGGSKPLDNPDNVHLLIYRCSDMADNCGLCLSLSEKFGCGWCQGSDRCEVQGQCGAPSVWLNQGQTCPNAAVHSSHPQIDPSNGTTNITNETSTQDTCSTYKSCTQCVSFSFPCDWCLDSHRCTHNTAESCRNDILVTGVGRTGPSYRSGPGFCPRINSTSDGTNEILVPYGVKKAIKVKVRVIGQFIVQTRFVCQFNIEGRVLHVNAQLLADTVYCDAMDFTYTSRAPNMTASFAIVWGGSKPLDNPDNVHLLIYRCSDMADNCGLCLSLSEKFGCGWCQGSDRCEAQGQCGAQIVWLNQGQTCPDAAVHSLHPQVDLSDGTTNITNVTSTQDTCSTYKSCTQCVSSSFPCDWCLDSHRCTHNTVESCRNDILVTGVGRTGPSYRSGPGVCPRINSTSDGTNEILVPYGVKKAIKVKVRVIGQFIVQTRFVCQFNIEGRVMHVNAQLLADTIYCDAMEFTYTSRAPNMTASFAIVWGGSKPLDNPDNVHLLIYRCNDMADNCELCLSLSEKFGCGWCQGSDRCEVQGQCDAPGVWLDRRQICPKAEVQSSFP